jgi:hypothetical protein
LKAHLNSNAYGKLKVEICNLNNLKNSNIVDTFEMTNECENKYKNQTLYIVFDFDDSTVEFSLEGDGVLSIPISKIK